MEIGEFRKKAHEFTAKLSEINRNLAYAGIAIIWIFKIQNSNKITIPNALLFPLLFIVLTLILDITHYIYNSIIWSLFHRRKEKEGLKNNDIKAPKWYSNVAYFIFFGKVLTNLIGYIFLILYLSKELEFIK
ncbi:MAG: hypothetical protein JXB00_00080 [Bacteroidales bacterium]|nr:hypothetical protein [Bacteroidales bacterium]